MGISFGDLKDLTLGGARDNAALGLAALGGLATSPALIGLGPTGILGGAALAAAGGALLGRRLRRYLRLDAFESAEDGLALNSHAPLARAMSEGVHLGFIADSGAPLIVPTAEWTRHAMIVGQSGVGKTVLGEWVMAQQIAKGGGLLWVDGKLAEQNLERLWALCAYYGREDDLLVINPGNPVMSNSYNPCLDGDPDEIASRFGSIVPSSESNPGSDHYRQSAITAITTLVEAIRSKYKAFNFTDIRLLLTSSRALNKLLNQVGERSEAGETLNLFLEQFRTAKAGAEGQGPISVDRIRKLFGGMGSRLAQFSQGNFGQVMNTYTPEVRLYDCIMDKKILYVMLPTMGKDEAARALGKMVIGDLRSAVARVQALPEAKRPDPPYLSYYDEAGSYVTQSWDRMFEQSRDARITMVPAFQTEANLEVLGKGLRAMVAGNTTTKIFFRPGEPDTAEWMAEMIGKEKQVQYGVSGSAASSKKTVAITDRMRTGSADADTKNSNMGYSETAREDYRVSPDDLSHLGKGECVVTVGHRVYHVKVPLIAFDPAFLKTIGPFRVAHYRATGMRHSDGLNMREMLRSKS